jgi:DNA-binding NtrC family response regulator
LIAGADSNTAKPALRVLLIQGSPGHAGRALEQLRCAGYLLECEHIDSADALGTALRERTWQLVLCDYTMPRFDALAALAIVLARRLDLPFIILADAIGEDAAVAAMRAGAHDILLAGELGRLLAAVERELRAAALRAERAALEQQPHLPARLAQSETRPLIDSPARRGRVLVIDDERAIVDIIVRVLRSEHDMVGVTSARAAMKLLQEDSAFDVIFCDLMMPEMSGVELHQELQQTAPALLERIVFLSGGVFSAAAAQFLSRIDNLRIQKPFNQKLLRSVVRDQLSRLDGRRGEVVRAEP